MKITYEFDLDTHPELAQEAKDSYDGVSWRATCQDMLTWLERRRDNCKDNTRTNKEAQYAINALIGIARERSLDIWD